LLELAGSDVLGILQVQSGSLDNAYFMQGAQQRGVAERNIRTGFTRSSDRMMLKGISKYIVYQVTLS